MHVTNPDALPIPGLVYIPDFITEAEQDELIQLIDSQPFSTAIHRRQQFYGERYYHTTHNLPSVQPTDEASEKEHYLPLSLMQSLIDKLMACQVFGSDPEQSPTQCLVNEYVRNQGISSHFDDSSAFGDVIASISLIDPIYMTLKRPVTLGSNECQDIIHETKIYLEPRSLLILKDDARTLWRHGITKAKIIEHPVTRTRLRRNEHYRRLSITIRKVLAGRKKSTLGDRTDDRHLSTDCT